MPIWFCKACPASLPSPRIAFVLVFHIIHPVEGSPNAAGAQHVTSRSPQFGQCTLIADASPATSSKTTRRMLGYCGIITVVD